MSDPRQPEVLGSLPRRRPQRRSTKRPIKANGNHAPAAEPSGKLTTSPASSAGAASPTRSAARSPRPAMAGKRAPGAQPTRLPRAQDRPAARSGAPARGKGSSDRLRQPPQPRGIPSSPRSPVPSAPQRPEILGTVVQAAAELTEIGLSLGAQVLRRAVARLPRP